MKIIILAGGGGSRLFPLSRKSYPKQFLKLEDEKSLLVHTVERFLDFVVPEDILVVTNQRYLYHVQNELAECQAEGAHIILEPVARNTAPAIGLAVQFCEEKLGCEGREPLVVAAADHVIRPQDVFTACIAEAAEVVQQGDGSLVTFGIPAKSPETGYGYIGNEIASGTSRRAHRMASRLSSSRSRRSRISRQQSAMSPRAITTGIRACLPSRLTS